MPDTETKFRKLAQLAYDKYSEGIFLTFQPHLSASIHFQHVAEVYGRIIISEQFVPNEDKTIKPQNIGNWLGFY